MDQEICLDQLPRLREITFTFAMADPSLHIPLPPGDAHGSGRYGEFAYHRYPDGATGPVWFRHLSQADLADVLRRSHGGWYDPHVQGLVSTGDPDMAMRVNVIRLQTAEAPETPAGWTLLRDGRRPEEPRMAKLRTVWHRIGESFNYIWEPRVLDFAGYRIQTWITRR